MTPIKTTDTQDTFAGDMPYRYVLTTNGAAIAVTWKASFLDRLKLLFKGTITIKTYSSVQPPMSINVGEK